MCTENVFWEDTRQQVERGSECKATHTYTLLPRTQGHFRGPSPQDVALMQALVRIQAYTLADIVVAIPVVDLAVEAVVWGRVGGPACYAIAC